MSTKTLCSSLVVVLSLSSGLSQAEQLINGELMSQTENGVFLPDGRYFVAGSSGIQEVKSTPDDNYNCDVDPQSNLTVCTLVAPELEGHKCFYSSLTSDGTYLYATCTDWKQGLLGTFQKPNYASFLRILPGESGADEVIVREFPQPVWYNGMDMLDGNSILMTQSVANQGSGNSSIIKLDITNADTLDFEISDWLPSSSLYLNPNGLAIDDGYVFFIGGQNLFRIRINRDGSAGTPFLLYQSVLTRILDDITVIGDRVLIAEAGLATGAIVSVHKFGAALPSRINTGTVQLSDLDLDPGTFSQGALIGTSYYKGGVYSFPLPQ